MGTVRSEMTIDRLLVRLANLEQENASLRAAWERRGEAPGTASSRPHAAHPALVGAAVTEVGDSREATSPN